MTTTMQRLTAKEKVQIGTLKALGFSDRRILRHYTPYAFMVGILGIGFGVGLGYAVAYLIMNPNGMMDTYLDLPRWQLCFPWFCYLVLLGILSLLTLIGYLSVRKMLQGTAADALRPYTPKKMRPLLIEKSRIFHKLSFGVLESAGYCPAKIPYSHESAGDHRLYVPFWWLAPWECGIP